jgi:hypothetical protein
MALHLILTVLYPKENSRELQFFSIGFKTKVVAIEGSFINITLEEEQNN